MAAASTAADPSELCVLDAGVNSALILLAVQLDYQTVATVSDELSSIMGLVGLSSTSSNKSRPPGFKTLLKTTKL